MKTRAIDTRFSEPLYTVAEAARFLGVNPQTLSNWAHGYKRNPPGRPVVQGAPIIAGTTAVRNYPSIPFIGLAGGMVLAAFRREGLSLQYIRKAVRVLECEISIEHALASQRLYTDGAVILYDYALSDSSELAGLTEVVFQQRVFSSVIREYLSRIEYAGDGLARKLVSPVTQRPIVVADPALSFGQPTFIKGAVRVEDVIDRFRAGDPLTDVAEDFGVPVEDVEDVLRVSLPVAV